MKHFRTLIILALAFVALFSCEETDEEYEQFTKKELDFLVFEPDTFRYTGSSYSIEDSIRYTMLAKDSSCTGDTVWVNYYTGIGDSEWLPSIGLTPLDGKTFFYFTKVPFLEYGVVRLFKDGSDFADVRFKLSSDSSFFNNIYYSVDPLDAITDTLLLNGVVHENVIKFHFKVKEVEYNNFKKIYYKKRFGFILIETHDGERLEALSPED